VTAVEYRILQHLPVAGADRDSPVPIQVCLVARQLYVVKCWVCNSSTQPTSWLAANKAGISHRCAHARVLAGEPLQALYPVTPAPALAAAVA
jgi:hypothetical protein